MSRRMRHHHINADGAAPGRGNVPQPVLISWMAFYAAIQLIPIIQCDSLPLPLFLT